MGRLESGPRVGAGGLPSGVFSVGGSLREVFSPGELSARIIGAPRLLDQYAFPATDKRTDEPTNRRTWPSRNAPL